MAAGTLSGALSDVGINDDFMKQLAGNFKNNSSLLFVLVRKATPDKVLAEVQGTGGTIIKTSLTHEDEEKLQAVLNAAKTQEVPAEGTEKAVNLDKSETDN